MNRRNLLQGLSFSMLAAKLSGASRLYGQAAELKPEPSRPTAANDRINIGIIGPGSRGQEVLRQFLRTPGVEIVAQCDVYEPRFAEVNELVGKDVQTYKDYREMLQRKDLDAIVIGTPPVYHAEYAIAALESGKPVYGEKTLGFTPEDSQNVVDAVAKTGQIFQIGHQMRYASWIGDSIDRVHRGEIGEPLQVYAYYHRSDNWRREVPNPSLEHLMNWRLYNETSGGLFEELGSHQIDIANWVFKAQPEDVMGTTSISVYKDGRTVGDNVQAIIGYSEGRRLFFSSITDNALLGNQIWVFGTNGSLQITSQDATFYIKREKTITAASHTHVITRGLKTGASFDPNSTMPYRGPGIAVPVRNSEEPTLTACKAFAESVRTKKQPFADVEVGYGSAMTCSIGKRAFAEGRTMKVPQLKQPS
jgi:predicted dehydrogenase